MNTAILTKHQPDLPLSQLTKTLAARWPQACNLGGDWSQIVFTSGMQSFDSLFAGGGIPYGQLIEITGDICCGKTTFLLKLLAGMTASMPDLRAAYIDYSHSFFPPSAVEQGIDLNRLLIAKPKSMATGLRTAELIFRHELARLVLIDLVGVTQPLPMTLLHRLRLQTIKAKGLVVLLTEQPAGRMSEKIIANSMVSLRLKVTGGDQSTMNVTVIKSRICKEQHSCIYLK